MTSLRSQAAPLPTRLQQCARAYAAGNHTLGEQLLPAALTECENAIYATIHKRGVPIDDHQDTHQETLIRIIRQLKRGICPTISTVTYHTIVDAYRKQHTTGRRRTPIPRAITLDAVAETVDETTNTEHAALNPSDESAARLLAVICAQSPQLALIAQYSIDGLTANQIATAMNTPRVHIRESLLEIRRIIETETA